MEKYDFKKIEKKWQDKWYNSDAFKAIDFHPTKPKYYALYEFFNISGNLHMGHLKATVPTDALARYKRFCGYNKNRLKLYEQITDQKNTSPLFQLLENEEELFEDPLLKIKSKAYDYIKEDNYNLENINKMINDYYSNKDLFKDTSDLYKLRSELMFRLYFGIYDDESKIKLTKHINREVSDEENFGFTEIGKIFGTTYNRALSSINSDIKNIKKLGLFKKYMGDINE